MSTTRIHPELTSDERAELTALLDEGGLVREAGDGRELAAHDLVALIEAEARRYTEMAGQLNAVLDSSRTRHRTAWARQPRPAGHSEDG